MGTEAATDYTIATATIKVHSNGHMYDEGGPEGSFLAVVTFSDGRDPVRGEVSPSDREGAPSPDAWLTGGLEHLDGDILEALSRGEDATLEVPSVLEAEELADGWCVRHDSAVWWPTDAAQAEIESSDDPEQAVLHLCITQPGTAGEWKY